MLSDLIKWGLVTNENKPNVNIPILSLDDYKQIKDLNTHYGQIHINLLGQKSIDFIRTNAIDYPKRINPVPPFVHIYPSTGRVNSYFLKAVDEGVINLYDDKNIPIAMIIEGKI